MTRSRWALITVSAMTLVGCSGGVFGVRGSGTTTTETREVSGFTGIILEGTGKVVVEVTGIESLSIEAEDNLLPSLTSEVEDGSLVLGTQGSINPTRPIVYTITVAHLDSVAISGSGEVEGDGVSGDDLDVRISGSGAASLTGVDVATLVAEISGSGAIGISGVAPDVDISIPGSGAFHGRDLQAVRANVSISGSGSASVNATDVLEATVSGSGKVEYLGDPAVTSDITGSGQVSPG